MQKDEVRQWLDERCGRVVNIETRVNNDTAPPLLNEGSLSKQRSPNADATVYQVGSLSYNLADIPDDVDVRTQSEPPERLEMTFDGASGSITVLITVADSG